MKGDRELLFLGRPANYAAKIIGPAWQMRVTAQLYDALPEPLQELCEELEDEIYVLNALAGDEVEELAAEFNISWDAEASRARIQQDKRTFPLKEIRYSEADTLIDLDSLGIKNNKRVLAASLFADVDKFTAYIDGAKTTEQKKTALRVLHAIRKEMAAVVKHDFDGLRIQYQGDRVQALFHLPKDDGGKIVNKTVEVAVALQSSMELCIKRLLPESSPLGLALGLDIDITLVSKLGIRGDRDRICIGTAVQRAAETQEACHSLEIGTTSRAYSLITDDSAGQFTFDKQRGVYVAKGLTVEKMERLAKAAAYRSGSPVFVSSSSAGVAVRSSKVANEREVFPARSYCA
jgi:class 3 adenylate cyclase